MKRGNRVLSALWMSMFALAATLNACGDNKDAGPQDTTTSVDTALPDTAFADTDQTGTGNRCISNDDCEMSGAICACDGQCVVPTGNACTEDRNCGVPRWCNPCTGHCEEQAELCGSCSDARGCRDQGACLPYATGGNYCGTACISDVGCPRGYRCADIDGLATKQCVARTGVCESLAVCAGDNDCPVGSICQVQTGQCIEGCVDGGCPNNDVCVASRCRAPCTTNGDCEAPAICEDNGKCRIPGTCQDRIDCPDAETYCDRASGQCTSGCEVDLDCGDAAKVCERGECVAKGCQHNYQCAFGQICNKATAACVPYPASEPYCTVCDPQSEQDPACPGPNLCVTFQDDEGAALGDHCLVPCKDDPVDACPSGWSCQRIDDGQGGEPQFMCARPCYITPVANP